jgi:hypothetical protein
MIKEFVMRKILMTLTAAIAVFAAGAATAQVGKAASEATDSARHKIDEKRADSEAKKSGPVGKTVNKAKSEYHENRSKAAAGKAKKAVTDPK